MNSFVFDIKNYLPQENIDIAIKVFEKFDKEKKNEVPVKDLVNMLRLLGITYNLLNLDFNPTEHDVKEMTDLLEEDPNNPKSVVTKEGLLTCMARLTRDADTIDELVACFKLFDKENRGHLSEPVIRYILCSLGDSFTDEEMDLTMKDCNPYIEVIGDVKYVDYVQYSNYLLGLHSIPKPKPEDNAKGKGKGKGK